MQYWFLVDMLLVTGLPVPQLPVTSAPVTSAQSPAANYFISIPPQPMPLNKYIVPPGQFWHKLCQKGTLLTHSCTQALLHFCTPAL